MLTTALQKAKSGLSVASEQIGVVSRNVTRNGDPNATRKLASTVTAPGGGVVLSPIVRSTDRVLLDAVLTAASAAAGIKVTSDALDRLQAVIGEVDDARSPAALVGQLADALQFYSSTPADGQSARSVVSAAHALTQGLNDAADAVAELRQDADAAIVASVAKINELLSRFEIVNRKVVVGTRGGQDVTDQLDERDGIAKAIAEEVGLRVVRQGDEDMRLYTDSGATLFETAARKVTFTPAPLMSGKPGGVIKIDGVPVAGVGQTMALVGGRLRALVDLRDGAAETFSTQLDEMARGLITGFAEHAVTPASGLPDVPGLLKSSTSMVFPSDGIRVPGLAATLVVNAAYDPAQGGDAFRVRDGGAAGPAYNANSTGNAGDTGRIFVLIDKLGVSFNLATDAKLGLTSSLQSLGAMSVGWLAQSRKDSTDDYDYRATVQARAEDALLRETGVSLDQEMSDMLELERSYQASSRLLTAIDEMFRILLGTAA